MEKWEFRERESFSVERDDRSVYLFSREREKRFDFLCHPVALPSLLHRFQILRSMDVDVKKKKFRSTFSVSLSRVIILSFLEIFGWQDNGSARQRFARILRGGTTMAFTTGTLRGLLVTVVAPCSLARHFHTMPRHFHTRRDALPVFTRAAFFSQRRRLESPLCHAASDLGQIRPPQNFFASPRISKWRIERGFDPRLRVSIFELISKDSMTRTNEDVTHLFLIRFE